ncbi:MULTISPECIES: hypothetical protein [Pseudomonas]|uniref:Uncharacterized protein n=1 Tax=Pseudomonas veronii TaxID=76761 RepID=A0ABS0VQ11_PSEVE|nr:MULTISPECIES: hypothetical protein [Pseudomonas]MBI6652453.1 hypothetical protein [Pseudomonas veronii]MCF1249249.1 hypothetical protein [Pseudomonas putida]
MATLIQKSGTGAAQSLTEAPKNQQIARGSHSGQNAQNEQQDGQTTDEKNGDLQVRFLLQNLATNRHFHNLLNH